jgi:hypothetical protein
VIDSVLLACVVVLAELVKPDCGGVRGWFLEAYLEIGVVMGVDDTPGPPISGVAMVDCGWLGVVVCRKDDVSDSRSLTLLP